MLDGASAGTISVGLSLASTAAGSTVKGLAIDSFAAGGVLINGGSNDLVMADYIGVTAAGTGTSTSGNGIFGVAIEGGATGVTIGGTTAAAGDVISGNPEYGVAITSASMNVVEGDFIGTAAGGAAALLDGTGVALLSGASEGTIGGLSTAARDVIAGNQNQGVSIVNSSSNVVEGDYIGVGANGAQALGNGQGVLVQNTATSQLTTGNTIGGTSSLARDVISGNLSQGVSISGAAGTAVQGDYIGLDAPGTAPVEVNDERPQITGISLSNATGTTIGGSVAGAGDTITRKTVTTRHRCHEFLEHLDRRRRYRHRSLRQL